MSSYRERITYSRKTGFTWIMPSLSVPKGMPVELDEICKTCDSIKDKQIGELKTENKKLKRLVKFLQDEIKTLELKAALDGEAIPLKEIVAEFTSTAEGKRAWERAWKDQNEEWKELVSQGRMSPIKYHRLLNGMDQKTLARKLGTAQPNISRMERVGYNVPTSTLKKLAEIFKVKVEDLIGD
ncbi:MAG: helix-turn-helix transcriptional regulator [Deferribacteres bacterium]|nr:helix-turn-helix transcriptional regulator [Deferribacteres bacterium]